MPERGSSARAAELRRLLIEARHANGLKQTELAKLLGRPQSFVSNYEGGQRRLAVIEFIDIAKALGLDPSAVVRELVAVR
jgi:transcriptional regulator with XRE-family HTH domain